MENIPAELDIGRNQRILAYLSGASAHGDLGEALRNAVKSLGDARIYCPDVSHFRYIAIHTNQTIFSYAVGMSTAAFRLDQEFKSKALITGGKAIESVGEEWIAFELFRSDWPEIDLRFWATKAYVYAREHKSPN